MDDERNLRKSRPLSVTPRITFEVVQPSSALVGVEVAGRCHPGRLATNEDHYLIVRMGRHQETLATSLPYGEVPARFDESAFGMIVADGMGATGSGETASRLAIATLAHLVLHFGEWAVRIDERTAGEVLDRAERFYRKVDQTVAEAAEGHPSLSGMSTTLTAAYSAGDSLFIAHVGHSRVYLLRNGLLTQSTRDQTLAQRQADTNRLAPIELAARDLRHILTDAMGGRTGSPAIEIAHFKLQHRDRVLLCTNGLTDVVDDQLLAEALLQPSSPASICDGLVDLALARGSTDNITVVMADYSIPAVAARG